MPWSPLACFLLRISKCVLVGTNIVCWQEGINTWVLFFGGQFPQLVPQAEWHKLAMRGSSQKL